MQESQYRMSDPIFNTGLVGYITTPDGSLKKYDPKTKTETVVNIKQPSDPNDPDRKNKIN